MSDVRKRAHLSSAVERFMVPKLVAVEGDRTLPEVEAVLEEHGISSVPVTDGGRMIGVLSRTDLLRAAAREAAGHGEPAVVLPPRQARDVATKDVVTVRAEESLSAAAGRMMKGRIHRVFVVADDPQRPVGVLSTKDLLTAISKDRVEIPIGDVMSHPAFTIPVLATVAQAVQRLEHAHVSGLVVVDEDGWPVGIFSQTEALRSRHLRGDASVEDAMNHALVCLHRRAPLHRAAALAHAARARRVLVIDDRKVAGVVTPLDFVRAVSG